MSAQDDFETGWTSGGWMDDSPMSNEPTPPPPPPPALTFVPLEEPVMSAEQPKPSEPARKPATRKAAPRKAAKKAAKSGRKAAKRAPANKKAA